MIINAMCSDCGNSPYEASPKLSSCCVDCMALRTRFMRAVSTDKTIPASVFTVVQKAIQQRSHTASNLMRDALEIVADR